MIPLVEPLYPSTDRIVAFFSKVSHTRQLTNFGKLWWMAHERLSDMFEAFVLPTTSGTTALEVALISLDLAPGAKVLLPDYTHISTLNAVVRARYQPILVPVSEQTWIPDLERMDQLITETQASAFIIVSPFGYEVNTFAWDILAAKRGIPLVYDLAGAFGMYPKTSNIQCYSLHATKNLGVGEGGLIVFPDGDAFDYARRLISFDGDGLSIYSSRGLNGKIDELKAAAILAALEPEHLSRVWDRIVQKRFVLEFYLDHLDGVYVPKGTHYPSLTVLSGLPGEAISRDSASLGFECKQYYKPLSTMGPLKEFVWRDASPPSMSNCWALPSSIDISRAYEIVDGIISHMGGSG